MKRGIYLMLLMAIGVGLCGCSMKSMDSRKGIPVMFDGIPQVFETSIQSKGTVVGQIISREWRNGVTRVVIALEGEYDALKRNNLAFVVKNGQLHAVQLGGYGEPLSADACINGFVNTSSLQWFKFKHLMGNIIISADRRAQNLLSRSGLSG